jgi:hypothetical protein
MASRYEDFKKNAQEQQEKNIYRETIKGNGGFEYNQQVFDLITFSNKVNSNLLIYLFGEQIGNHLSEKFVNECKRNFLIFLTKIDGEMRFFILNEIKTNTSLYAYC